MKPKRLQKGDKIGIVSPSDPVKDKFRRELDNGIQFLEKVGFNVVTGDNISSRNPEERAKDINSFFADPKIDGIICSKGGDTAQDTLPFVDWEIIKANPKIFLGISDITVYLNAINTKTGLITFHGNDASYGLGVDRTDYDEEEFFSRLVDGKTGEIKANKKRNIIQDGVAEGRLLGGNLRCLLKLAETEYWPDFSDSILMLEAYHLKPKECRELFRTLEELKVFDKINGVLIGYVYGMQAQHPEDEQMEDIILEFVKNKPILKCNDFGHNTPNTTLPIGAKVRVDATNKKIEILEDFVE